jgi:hypothetical protein
VIECRDKDEPNKIELDEARSFATVVRHLDADGVMVTTTDFTAGARTLAADDGLRLMTRMPFLPEDAAGRLAAIDVRARTVMPVADDVHIKAPSAEGSDFGEGSHTMPLDAFILKGSHAATLRDLLGSLMDAPLEGPVPEGSQTTVREFAVTLVDAGVGHACLPMVRPACGELIWVKYLGTLPPGERGALLHSLNSVEGSKLIGAQAAHLGAETMTAVGCPPPFVDALTRRLTEGERLLADAGKTLGWPKSPPSGWWLAKGVGLADMYRFLYAATCKGLHFSVTEHLRSGYNDSTLEGAITFAAPAYVAYRSGFTVYWRCDLLGPHACRGVGGDIGSQ